MEFFVFLLHVGKANKEIRKAEPNIKEGTKIYDPSLDFSLGDLRLMPEYKLAQILCDSISKYHLPLIALRFLIFVA